jgi:hypothetical protein
MNIEVTLLDGSKLFPSYDPAHRKGVLAFYEDKFEKGLISGWKVLG